MTYWPQKPSREWYEKRIAEEGTSEVGAGSVLPPSGPPNEEVSSFELPDTFRSDRPGQPPAFVSEDGQPFDLSTATAPHEGLSRLDFAAGIILAVCVLFAGTLIFTFGVWAGRL